MTLTFCWFIWDRTINSWKQVIHEPKYLCIFMTFIRIYTLFNCTCIFKIIKTLERITPLPMHPSTSVSKHSYYQYCKYSFAISSERHFCFCSRWNIAQVNSLASPHLSFFYPKRRDWLVVDWSKEDLINATRCKGEVSQDFKKSFV